MDQENIMFFENDDKSYTVVDQYIHSNRHLKYIDSYNDYDIDVDKILLLKKSDNEYIIYNDDKEFFRKYIEIWDKIIELMNINNHMYFPKADGDDELFIMADVHENTSFVFEDSYGYGHNKVVIVLHSVVNACRKTSFVQPDINKHKVKYITNACILKLL